MNKKISLGAAIAYMAIVAAVAFSLTMIYSMNLFNVKMTGITEREKMYSSLHEVDLYVRENYYGSINEEALQEAIARGYIDGLEDSNARYFTAAEYEAYTQSGSGKYVGVGLVTEMDSSGYLLVREVYPDSPAQMAGIKVGALITNVNGTRVTENNNESMAGRLRGEAGTKVTLTIQQDSQENNYELTLRAIEVPTVKTTMVSEDTAYISFTEWSGTTADQFIAQLNALKAQEVKGILLDVRGVTSNELSYAVRLLDPLLPSGTVAYSRDKDGNLTDYRFVKSVIRSRVKGVYSEINALLAGSTDDELTGKYHEVLAQLPAMKELYGHRARLRKERGCMDIESGEVKLILDEDGHCIDVKKRTSGESEAMIEEFMLLANQCAAHFARVKQIPFVYRVHEEPNAEKLERLHGLLQACGVNDHFAKDVPTPKELSAILESVRGTAYEQIINVGMLRCMSKAVYEEKPKGHYGLVLQDYAHFTSPIRRYPDLAIHRIMTAQLKGTDKDTMILRYSEFAEDVSKQASEREVIAMQIERKAEDCYKAEYARRHLGECYEGRISGVTQRGLFIELENGVEGFVPASSLTATGTMLTEGVRLSDPVSGKNWNLGDTMISMYIDYVKSMMTATY